MQKREVRQERGGQERERGWRGGGERGQVKESGCS